MAVVFTVRFWRASHWQRLRVSTSTCGQRDMREATSHLVLSHDGMLQMRLPEEVQLKEARGEEIKI